jgi:NAD(P)-dependent dehydrogenase (short-subunit alcohol dehydrogenase family)
MHFTSKICCVTGASSGMGRELAISLSRRGASGLALCDVNMKELEETARLCKQQQQQVEILIQKVDVSKRDQVEAFHAEILKKFGGCDVLFNNAGINASGKMVYEPGEDPKEFEKVWDRCFEIDFFGVLHFTRVFLPTLIKSKEAYLVNTASVNGFYTWPEHAAYTSAKHAVKGLTDSLKIELAIKAPHVGVACVMPGGVKTNVAASTLHPGIQKNNEATFRKTTDEVYDKVFDLTSAEAADWILDAVEKNETRILVGYDAWLLDKLARLFPSKMYSFYPELGRQGLFTDPYVKQPPVPTPFGVLKLLYHGLWIHVVFLSPMILIKARHFINLKIPAIAGAALIAARYAGKL